MLTTSEVNLQSKIEDLRMRIATYDGVLYALQNPTRESSTRSSPVSSAGTSSSSMDSLESVIVESRSVEQQLEVVSKRREEAVCELSLHKNISDLLLQREKLIQTLCEKAGNKQVISRAEIEKWAQFAESFASQSKEFDKFFYKHPASYEYFARMYLQTPQSQRPSGVSFFSLTNLLKTVNLYDSKVSRTLFKLARIDPDLSSSIEEELARLNDAIQKNVIALEKGLGMMQSVATNAHGFFGQQGSRTVTLRAGLA